MKAPVKLLWLITIIFLVALVTLVHSPTAKKIVTTLENAVPPKQPVLESTTSSTHAPSQTFMVRRVVDGDTIEISTGQKVRYIGMNTPETVDPRKPVQCFGKEASSKNKELVEGKQVRLEKDVSETDMYGRLLRYVYVELGGHEVFVNDYLVKNGYAELDTFPPDVKYQAVFLASQKEARNKGLGLWSACD